MVQLSFFNCELTVELPDGKKTLFLILMAMRSLKLPINIHEQN